MQRFLRNLTLRTDDGHLRHDSSSADKVKQPLQKIVKTQKFKSLKNQKKKCFEIGGVVFFPTFGINSLDVFWEKGFTDGLMTDGPNDGCPCDKLCSSTNQS